MKKQKKKHEIFKLGRFYKKYIKFLLLTLLFSGTYTVLAVYITILSGNLLDSFTYFVASETIKIALILCAVSIAIEIITNLWSRTVLKLNSSVDFDIKHKMLQSLLSLKIKNFDNFNSGVFVARINKDANNLAELFDEITDDLSNILINVSFIAYSFFLNIFVGLFFLFSIFVIYILESIKTNIILKSILSIKN